MSLKVMSDVWAYSKASATPLLVLLCLADWADDEGECCPSISTIARKCRLGKRQVRRVIQTIESDLGEVVVIPNGGEASTPGGTPSNQYRVTVPTGGDSA